MSFIRKVPKTNSIQIVKTGTAEGSLADIANLVVFNNSTSDYNYTIPPATTVAFPKMSWIEIKKTGTGDITVVKGSGVTFAGPLGDVNFKLDGEHGYSVFIRKIGTDLWEYSGSIKSV